MKKFDPAKLTELKIVPNGPIWQECEGNQAKIEELKANAKNGDRDAVAMLKLEWLYASYDESIHFMEGQKKVLLAELCNASKTT